MAHVLCLDADNDLITAYVLAFRRKFVFNRFADTWTQHSARYLSGLHCVQPTVDKELRSNPPDYITGAGHGLSDSFKGFGDGEIWTAEQDLTFLGTSIVHLFSCYCGVTLGQAMIRDGVRAFWGYTGEFAFYHEDPPPRDLSKDKWAAALIKMDCLIDIGVLDGHTAEEIYESISDYFEDLYAQLDGEVDQELLLRNYECLVGPLTQYGDVGATV